MKKTIALMLTFLLAVMSFAACEEPDEKKTTNTTEVAEAEQKETEELSDEEAIIQIIDDLYRASCKMDYEEAKKIVHERLYDDLGNIEQQLIEMYEIMAEHGIIYKDDIEKHLTTDLNYHKKMSEKNSYEIESISINGDEATVKIIAESAEADYDKLCEGVEEYGDLSPEVIYRKII